MTIKSISDLRDISLPAELYVEASIEEHCWPLAQSMLRWWYDKKSCAAAPHRAAMSPVELSGALPTLTIFDVSWDPFLMKCRMMGSAFADAIGYDATGNYADDVSRTETLLHRAKWIATHVEPMLITGLPLVWSPEKSYKTYDTLCLPFIDNEGLVDTILYLNQFHVP